MKTQQEHQAIINELEETLPGAIQHMTQAQIIPRLNAYVESGDNLGVRRSPTAIVSALKEAGHLSIYEVPEAIRNGNTRENLGACIIGNFIHSNGCPPPNLMGRFCEEYESMN